MIDDDSSNAALTTPTPLPTIDTNIMEPVKRSLVPDDDVAVSVNEPKKLKTMKKHLCVFTSASSTLQGATEYPVCNAANDDSVLMTKCHGCGTSH